MAARAPLPLTTLSSAAWPVVTADSAPASAGIRMVIVMVPSPVARMSEAKSGVAVPHVAALMRATTSCAILRRDLAGRPHIEPRLDRHRMAQRVDARASGERELLDLPQLLRGGVAHDVELDRHVLEAARRCVRHHVAAHIHGGAGDGLETVV